MLVRSLGKTIFYSNMITQTKTVLWRIVTNWRKHRHYGTKDKKRQAFTIQRNIVRSTITRRGTNVMISASYEGCCGIFPIYPLIRIHRLRYSMTNMSNTFTILDGEYIKHAHDIRWWVCQARSRYSMASMSSKNPTVI